MATQEVVRPVVSTSASKAENPVANWVNAEAISDSAIDKALYDGFQLQSQYDNETEFRIQYLADAILAQNKLVARNNVALYNRTIDQMAKLPKYRATHTRDQVEAEFLKMRDGKVLAAQAKLGAEYLSDNK